MRSLQLERLNFLRERREQRAREAMQASLAAENAPRAAVTQAQNSLDSERAARQEFAARWGRDSDAPTSVADQMAGRACLVRLDGEVEQHMKKMDEARSTLDKAVAATAETSVKLKTARIAREKSEQGAERYGEILQRNRLWSDEAQADEDLEVQVMARFTRDTQEPG
jgi:flagellar biosynthesis chaperone FliJ